MLAEVLLDMRGVPMPCVRQYKPARRGETARAILGALRTGPQTTSALAGVMLEKVPDLSRRAAYNRAFQALLRLEDAGKVSKCKNGWELAP